MDQYASLAKQAERSTRIGGVLGEDANAVRAQSLQDRAYELANIAERQATDLEAALGRIFGTETCDGASTDDISASLPASLSRIQMAQHRIAKCIENLREVA